MVGTAAHPEVGIPQLEIGNPQSAIGNLKLVKGMKMSNFQQLIVQAKKMQEKLQKEMAELRVEATAGGGIVAVTMNGSKQLLSVHIDKSAVENDVEMHGKQRSEEHTSELQSRPHLVCRLLLEKK